VNDWVNRARAARAPPRSSAARRELGPHLFADYAGAHVADGSGTAVPITGAASIPIAAGDVPPGRVGFYGHEVPDTSEATT
jgi:hypothetical protein